MNPVETKIFDPADGFGPVADLAEITDATITKRGDQWWLYAAGQMTGRTETELFSASLLPGQPLGAKGWRLSTQADHPTSIAPLASHNLSGAWDGKGGRHCPCYTRGWDPRAGKWVERIYYAGGAQNLWGPYTIGCLEWNGERWADEPEPVFAAEEAWEHGSVYEPNLIYADGLWKMWYVAGSNQEDYIVQGYAESADGRTGWSERRIFAAAEAKMFDFCVAKTKWGYEAIFAKVWLGKTPPTPDTGLWWCQAETPYPDFSKWSIADGIQGLGNPRSNIPKLRHSGCSFSSMESIRQRGRAHFLMRLLWDVWRLIGRSSSGGIRCLRLNSGITRNLRQATLATGRQIRY
jgi:hypothetical protein